MQHSYNLENLFEESLVKEIFQFGEIKHFKEGDVIMDFGKYIRMMPLVLKGTIKVSRLDESGREILLYYISNTESCSMAYSCCLEAKKSEVRAIAEDEVTLIALPHLKLEEWLCKYPKWKNYIIRSFNERFLSLAGDDDGRWPTLELRRRLRDRRGQSEKS